MEVIAMSEETMTTITIEFPDGTYEEMELPTREYQQILQRCEEENITLDEYLERAFNHYTLELDCRELVLQLEEMEERQEGNLDEIRSMKEKLLSAMVDPDWRQ
jgi:hypothetical protein